MLSSCSVLQVFDGHHGSQAAEYARERIVSSLLAQSSLSTDVKEAMVRVLFFRNTRSGDISLRQQVNFLIGVHKHGWVRVGLHNSVTDILIQTCAILDIDAGLHAEYVSGRIPRSGSTALVVLVWNEDIYVASVGDCKAVVSSRGQHIRLSALHRPVCDLEQRRILLAGGTVSEDHLAGTLSVTRSIGDYDLVDLKSVRGRGWMKPFVFGMTCKLC